MSAHFQKHPTTHHTIHFPLFLFLSLSLAMASIPFSDYEWCGAAERVGDIFGRPATLQPSGRPVWVHSIPKVKSRNAKKNAWREVDDVDEGKGAINELQLTLGGLGRGMRDGRFCVWFVGRR